MAKGWPAQREKAFCESGLIVEKLAALGERSYGSERRQSIEHARRTIQEALDVLNAER
jgi:hypothetical protein